MSVTPPPPVVVLSGHRSGSSYLMSVLGRAGLKIGEVIPADDGNSLGYWENRRALDANKAILGQFDRDWTNPPWLIEPGDVDSNPVLPTLEELSGSETWGFKDPRTMFTLSAWARHIDQFTFVGVHRSTERMARSLVRRNQFPFDDAFAIADYYTTRLRRLHEHIGFPVVNFDAPPDELRASIGSIVELLDLRTLSSDDDPFDERSITARSEPERLTESDQYFAHLDQPVRTVPIVSSAHLIQILRSLEPPRVADLSDARGPRFAERRRSAAAAGAGSDGGGPWLDIHPARSLTVPGVPRLGSPDEVIHASEVEASAAEGDRRYGLITAVDLLDSTPPDQVVDRLASVADLLDARGTAVLTGFLTDEPADATVTWLGRRRTYPDRAPYHHQEDYVLLAARRAGLHISGVERSYETRSVVTVTRDDRAEDVYETPSETRVALTDARIRITDLEGDLASERSARESAERAVAKLEARAADSARHTEDLEVRLAQAQERLTEQRSENVRLEGALKTASDGLAKEQRQTETLTTRLERSQEAHDRTSQMYDRLANRRVVRLLVGVNRRLQSLKSLLKRRPPGDTPTEAGDEPQAPARKEPTLRDQQALADRIRTSRNAAASSTGKLVSMIVLTRNGVDHITRLLDGLANRTDYEPFEVIVVDNGSTDGTAEVLAGPHGLDLTVISNDHNASFSAGNNQGLAVARGDYVLYLNNDVDPINPGWLGAMVDALEADERRAAVGAHLIYPIPTDPNSVTVHPPLTTQHRGIRFRWQHGGIRGYNVGAGEDPEADGIVRVESVPGVTAACLLARRGVLESLGGLDEAYVYGTEDVDLCCRIREQGHDIVFTGHAALFHHEFGTQDSLANHTKRVNRASNHQHFAERWTRLLAQHVERERFSGGGFWSGESGRTAAITVTRDDPSFGFGDWYTANELGQALESQGWTVSYVEQYGDHWYDLDPSTDVLICLLDACDITRIPEGVFTVAWVRNWVDRWADRPWFGAYDLVAASSTLAADELRLRSNHQPIVVPIATNPDRFSDATPSPTYQSDYVFTGNRWGQGRDIVNMLSVRQGERFMVFGKGWEDEARMQRYWRGHLPYEELPHVYASTKIVIDDTASHALPWGQMNSRVFDALAAGALVVTNNVEGSRELFDGELPTYTTRAELRAVLDEYLGDDESRRELTQRLRSRVLEDYTYESVARSIIDGSIQSVTAPKIRLRIGPPNHDVAEQWGDTHFARSFAKALSNHGYATAIDILPEWDAHAAQDADVVVHIRGLVPYATKPSHVNVLWLISHPDDLDPSELSEFDLAFVASTSYATALASQTDVPVVPLLQATEVDRFVPHEPDDELRCRALFVGNSRKVLRRSLELAIEGDVDVAVYGGGWEGLIPNSMVRAEHFPNADLARLYSSTGLLLNDHWDDMAEHGFISNRIFDALATGCAVATDDVAGLAELFGEYVSVYSDASSLREIAEQHAELPTEEERERRRAVILDNHTFDHRAREFLDHVEPLIPSGDRSLPLLRTDGR